jgi:hypothetical protein
MVATTRGNIHNPIAQFLELQSLQWLREIIRQHFSGKAMFDCDTLRIHLLYKLDHSLLFIKKKFKDASYD